MERNSMNISSDSLKDHKIGTKFSSNSNNQNSGSNKMKDSWNYSNSNSSYGEEYLSGFSWPPRSYTCSFCKREFRSAQALGGHMNVHRRDRARLRMSSPPPPRDNNNNNNNNNGRYPVLNLNLNPNPNPNPNFISTAPLVSPFSSLSSQSSASPSEMNKWGALNDALSPKGSVKKSAKSFTGAEEFDGCKLTKKADIVRLDLEIGLISDSKEDLDLELRLGYS